MLLQQDGVGHEQLQVEKLRHNMLDVGVGHDVTQLAATEGAGHTCSPRHTSG